MKLAKKKIFIISKKTNRKIEGARKSLNNTKNKLNLENNSGVGEN